MLLETIIAALVPVGVEGIKQAIVKWTGGVKPTTVDEQIKLLEADVRRVEALAALDNPYGTPSQWVIDLRASSRYLGALAVILSGVTALYTPNLPQEVVQVSMEAASVVFGFLFGQRIIINNSKGK